MKQINTEILYFGISQSICMLKSIPAAWPNPDCSGKLFGSDEGATKTCNEKQDAKA